MCKPQFLVLISELLLCLAFKKSLKLPICKWVIQPRWSEMNLYLHIVEDCNPRMDIVNICNSNELFS